jgi:hypothetical protein
MKHIPAIFDRTALDITNRTAKAFLNVSDWQRIYNNAQVANTLVSFLLSIDIVFDEVAEPTITTIPTVTQLNTLLANIERIRLASGLPAIPGLVEITSNWTAGSAADAPDYLDINAWEQVLSIIFFTAGLSVEYVIYCGISNAGQPRFYQHQFRQYKWVPSHFPAKRKGRTGISIAGAGLKRNSKYRRYEIGRKSITNASRCGTSNKIFRRYG